MTPKLTIIIPCYNCEQTLREAVESCYTQGFSIDEFEIVMVDDGSSDGTRELLEKLSSEYSNVRLFFHEKNKGGGAARNTAVANAKSDVIFCLDSDDILPPQTLSKMLSFLKQKQADGVTIHHSVNFRGDNTNDIDHIVTMSYVGEQIPFVSLLQKGEIRSGVYQVFMFTKEAFYRAGQYPTNHAFDTQGFAWRFLVANLKAYTCPNTTYLLRVHYKESYYLQEYNQGKVNYNWQKIFLEHRQMFKPGVLKFIENYNLRDFTKNIFDELKKIDNPFLDDYKNLLGQSKLNQINPTQERPIRRSGLYGIFLRIKHKLHL